MTEAHQRGVGIPWFTAEEYSDARRIMADAPSLPETWRDWLLSAFRIEDEVAGMGFVPIRAHIPPKRFEFWCSLRGLDPDAAARQRFASEVAGDRGWRH